MRQGRQGSTKTAVAAKRGKRGQIAPAELEARIETLTAELREAREHEDATAEILQIINSSRGDLAPVFEAMLEKAMRLCEAVCGHAGTFDGEYWHIQAARGDARFVEWITALGSFRAPPGSVAERLVRYKVPRSFERVEGQVRDDAGKVRRTALAADRAGGHASGANVKGTAG